eukprot:7946556-Pyramimonas_sp.AAC.1
MNFAKRKRAAQRRTPNTGNDQPGCPGVPKGAQGCPGARVPSRCPGVQVPGSPIALIALQLYSPIAL